MTVTKLDYVDIGENGWRTVEYVPPDQKAVIFNPIQALAVTADEFAVYVDGVWRCTECDGVLDIDEPGIVAGAIVWDDLGEGWEPYQAYAGVAECPLCGERALVFEWASSPPEKAPYKKREEL